MQPNFGKLERKKKIIKKSVFKINAIICWKKEREVTFTATLTEEKMITPLKLTASTKYTS